MGRDSPILQLQHFLVVERNDRAHPRNILPVLYAYDVADLQFPGGFHLLVTHERQ